MKKILFLIVLMSLNIVLFAQTNEKMPTIEELKKEQAAKKQEMAKLESEIKSLQSQIDKYPGWKFGTFGTIGVSLANFDNWYSNIKPNSSVGNIGIAENLYANLDRADYFWKNAANVNLAWEKSDNKDDDTDNTDFTGKTDIFKITSLFGYKLTKNFSVSALGEYRATLIENFNNPSFLDVGVGATWTPPVTGLLVAIHPLNYNFIFSESGSDYTSSLGTKIVADYSRKIGTINFKTNFTTFLSYKSSNYSNWTWSNSFAYTLWNGIGVGFEFGLRQNKQEAFNSPLTNYKSLDDADNKMQSFWLLGLSYAL